MNCVCVCVFCIANQLGNSTEVYMSSLGEAYNRLVLTPGLSTNYINTDTKCTDRST